MSLKAEVCQRLYSRKWTFTVYDTEDPGRAIAYAIYPANEWATALLDAQSALQRLHLKAFQDRVNETVRKLADIADYGVLRVTYTPPPPATLVWEGDYA